jgi:hypothetical protein
MAKLIHKSTRRRRIQFTLTPELYDANRETVALADELAVVIDYSRDFERWFKAQLEQVTAELALIKQNRAAVLPAPAIPAAVVVIVKPVASPSTAAEIEVEQAEEGDFGHNQL